MGKTQSLQTVTTKLIQIVEAAKRRGEAVRTLFHCIDEQFLKTAYQRTRKDAASGIDGQDGKAYGSNLEANLKELNERMRAGRYRASAVRRVRIPKEDGETRELGIPTFEDRIVQRAVTMLLEPIYEAEFYPSSYGFRPGKSAHQALNALRRECFECKVSTIIDADIQGCFDNIDHEKLKEVVRNKVEDGKVIQYIGKWLNAGVLDGTEILHPATGTPQGGVISPMLANIFLHTVLDEWFYTVVKPLLKGRSFLIRYADDFVLGFEHQSDAQRVMAVLANRFEKYGLKIHPKKTQILDFRQPSAEQMNRVSFDFLGFTHYWGKSRKGFWTIKRKTAKKRLRRTFKAVWNWCKAHRHDPLKTQQQSLSRKLLGHFNYFGIIFNYAQLRKVWRWVLKAWKYWLSHRSNDSYLSYAAFEKLLAYYPLPRPRILHSI